MASRAVAVPGPMADPGTPVAMADQAAVADPGTPAAMADPATMADPGIPAAMADPGIPAAMAEQEAWEAMADRGAWEASMVGSPPQNFLGETLLRGVLRRRRRSGFWGAGRSRQGLW